MKSKFKVIKGNAATIETELNELNKEYGVVVVGIVESVIDGNVRLTVILNLAEDSSS